MAIILGLDFETAGVDPATSDIIEVGAVLYDSNSRQMLDARSWLVSPDDLMGSLIPAEITKLTGITIEHLEVHGDLLEHIDDDLSNLISRADYLCAHNAEFEQGFLPKLQESYLVSVSKKWIDTMTDLPDGAGSGNLTGVAANHRFLNPFPHRALPDVLVMLAVLAQYDFSEIETIINAPIYMAVVQFPYDETNKRQNEAKSLGFRWNPDSKTWRKQIRSFEWEALKEAAEAKGFNPYLHDFHKEPLSTLF